MQSIKESKENEVEIFNDFEEPFSSILGKQIKKEFCSWQNCLWWEMRKLLSRLLKLEKGIFNSCGIIIKKFMEVSVDGKLANEIVEMKMEKSVMRKNWDCEITSIKSNFSSSPVRRTSSSWKWKYVFGFCP